MSGADLQDVADLLGHRDLRMTRRYSHVSPAHLSAAVKRLDGVFGRTMQGREAGHDGVTMENENSTKVRQTTASTKQVVNAPIYLPLPNIGEVQQTLAKEV
jgi:hypothetical protein